MMCCCEDICSKCWSCKLIVVGAIVLVTAIYWQGYIWHVIGGLLILKGLIYLIKPTCGHVGAVAAPKAKKKK